MLLYLPTFCFRYSLAYSLPCSYLSYVCGIHTKKNSALGPVSKNVCFWTTAGRIFYWKWVGRYSNIFFFLFKQLYFNVNIISTPFVLLLSFLLLFELGYWDYFFLLVTNMQLEQCTYEFSRSSKVIYQVFRFHFLCCKWLRVHVGKNIHQKVSCHF